MSAQIQFAPERRRGEQQARFGRGASQMGGGIGGIHRQITRRQMTPNEMAAWDLNRSLEKYPVFTSEARSDIQNEFVRMEGLRTMNMKTLAATLSFLRAVDNQPTPNSFRDEIIGPHISLLLPAGDMNPEDRARLTIRFKAQILIYIRAILNFRQNQ